MQKKKQKQNPLDHTNTQSRKQNKEKPTTPPSPSRREKRTMEELNSKVFTTTTTTERAREGQHPNSNKRKRVRERERERAEAKWTRYFGKFRKKLTPEEQVNIEKINKAVRWWQLACMTARKGWHHWHKQREQTSSAHVTWARVWRRKQYYKERKIVHDASMRD